MQVYHAHCRRPLYSGMPQFELTSKNHLIVIAALADTPGGGKWGRTTVF